jgi:hypothetical protein
LKARHINLTTSNGRITGNIIGEEDDYQREFKTSDGRLTINGIGYSNHLKDREEKDKTIYVKTSNASIDIDIY